MKHKILCYTSLVGMLLAVLLLAGCSDRQAPDRTQPAPGEATDTPSVPTETVELTIVNIDWSHFFHGLNGTAVVYDPAKETYTVYNEALADTQRSPCSTFKIISSFIGLENGIIDPENSVRNWSGEQFWNEDWNRDLDFYEAFRTSCVWYFREVADDIGPETMQKGLDALSYGNRDCSDWAGTLNTNNDNPALTGFWLESSLKISPEEQTEVMARIFGDHAIASESTQAALKQAMLVSEQDSNGLTVYGKTGMGKDNGVVVDAWFTGFAETPEGPQYFCVYLGQTDGENVSSAAAKSIALQILSDLFEEQ